MHCLDKKDWELPVTGHLVMLGIDNPTLIKIPVKFETFNSSMPNSIRISAVY
jgi:hypothetical protein